MSKYPSCEDRIDQSLAGRLSVLGDLWDLYLEDCEAYHPEHETNMYEYGLSFDYVAPLTFQDQTRGYFRYQLSWGGPSDEFRIYAEQVNAWTFIVDKIEYRFMDWFDGAHRNLRGADFDLLVTIFESFFVDSGIAHGVREEAMRE